MKRLKTAGLLCAALFLFVMSGTAQTKDDVINAFNAGAAALKAKNYAKTVESFQQVIDLGTKVGGPEADSLRKVAESKIAKFQFNYAYFGVSQNKASTNAQILAAFQKAKELAVKYNDPATSEQVDAVMPTIYTNMALAAYKANDLTGALADFDKVLALDPNNIQALFGKTIVYKKQNAFDPMIQAATKTLDVANKAADSATIKKMKSFLSNEYLIVANTPYLKMDYKATLEPIQEAIKYDDKNAIAYQILAVTENGLKDYDAALDAAEKGLKYEKPTNIDAIARLNYAKGVAFAGKGEKEKAIAAFKLSSVGKLAAPSAAYIKGLTAKPAPAKK